MSYAGPGRGVAKTVQTRFPILPPIENRSLLAAKVRRQNDGGQSEGVRQHWDGGRRHWRQGGVRHQTSNSYFLWLKYPHLTQYLNTCSGVLPKMATHCLNWTQD